MSKITTLDKAALIALRPRIEAALADLGAELGLKFSPGSGSYGGANGHFKLEIAVDDPAVQEAKERETWNRNCSLIGYQFDGLRPEDFGTEFVSGGTSYRTVGLALNRSKYPIKVEVLNGEKKGKIVLLTDVAVLAIRRATDAKAAGLPGFSGFADKKQTAAARRR